MQRKREAHVPYCSSLAADRGCGHHQSQTQLTQASVSALVQAVLLWATLTCPARTQCWQKVGHGHSTAQSKNYFCFPRDHISVPSQHQFAAQVRQISTSHQESHSLSIVVKYLNMPH